MGRLDSRAVQVQLGRGRQSLTLRAMIVFAIPTALRHDTAYNSLEVHVACVTPSDQQAEVLRRDKLGMTHKCVRFDVVLLEVHHHTHDFELDRPALAVSFLRFG